MARLFTPAVRCPECGYSNDHTFRFCQMCGYKRKTYLSREFATQSVNLEAIDIRLQELRLTSMKSAYSKQKTSLKSELERFLLSLPGEKSLCTATPIDICRFLAWKDKDGKTKIHEIQCAFRDQKQGCACKCPIRLSFNTVDSYIGKLRAIFKSMGRLGDWDHALGLGNPAASLPVKEYLKAVTAEQLQARITPKQATPLFVNKLLLLSRFLERKMKDAKLSPTSLYIMARDQAFFKTLFFSGDRGNDLGVVLTEEIVRFPQDDGFLFNHVWGKTLRDGSSNIFGIRRHPNPSLCPIKAIETYFAIATELRINLTPGYLFRPTNVQGHVVNNPFRSSTAESRLRVYLREAGLDEGETLHSFRSGSAITLALCGAPLAEIMSHVGWASKQTACYYLKIAQVLQPGGPSDILASDEHRLSDIGLNYLELNRLKGFVTAFPTGNTLKRASYSN